MSSPVLIDTMPREVNPVKPPSPVLDCPDCEQRDTLRREGHCSFCVNCGWCACSRY